MSVQDTPTRDSLRLESDKLVYDWGWIDCEERIIKLLEQEFNDTWPTGIAFIETSLPNLIELIKGETK